MTVVKECVKRVSYETKLTVAGTVLEFHQIHYSLQCEAPLGVKVKKPFKLWGLREGNFSAAKNKVAV